MAWSPDGNWIAFFADGKLKKVSPHGGPPQTIGPVPGFQEAAWGSNGDIIFRPTNRAPLLRIRDSGGSSEPLTTLNTSLTENSHRFPEFLPGGRWFFFVVGAGENQQRPLHRFVGLARGHSGHAGAVSGQLCSRGRRTPRVAGFFRDGALLAQRFHLEGRNVIGDAVPLFEHVGYNAPSIEARFRVSADGRVVVIQGGIRYTRFRWFDRSGEESACSAGRPRTPNPASSRRPSGLFAPRPTDWQPGCVVRRHRSRYHVSPDQPRGERLECRVVA